jgi:hypothetical protein
VRFHERRVTRAAPEVKQVRRRGLENSDAWINLVFSVRLTERYSASGGKDDERPNNSEAHTTCIH